MRKMSAARTEPARVVSPLLDEEVVARVLAGETALVEVLMRRHNQRLFRTARAVVQVAARELNGFLERAVDALPDIYRTVFVLREVEELSTAETADCLGISEELVKVRLHRARGELRRRLESRIGTAMRGVYGFHLSR